MMTYIQPHSPPTKMKKPQKPLSLESGDIIESDIISQTYPPVWYLPKFKVPLIWLTITNNEVKNPNANQNKEKSRRILFVTETLRPNMTNLAGQSPGFPWRLLFLDHTRKPNAACKKPVNKLKNMNVFLDFL